MKKRRILSLLLTLCIVFGAAASAFAAEPADELQYQEAAELMNYLGVLEPLGGSSLGGKAKEPVTWNEARAFTLAFSEHYAVKDWYDVGKNAPDALAEDRAITGAEFLNSFIHKMLLSDMRDDYFGGGAPDVTANIYRLLSGLGMSYNDFAAHTLTREEACQIMMNALDRNIGTYGFKLKNSCGVWEQISTDNSLTDEWCRPVSRWCRDGSGEPVTQWHTMSADYAGDGGITTHELLQTLGLYDFGEGNFHNNDWCSFHMIVNGDKNMDWTAGKLHWNHHDRSGCEKNFISDRTGSRMEVYYLGWGKEYIGDAGGDVDCRVYRVVYIDEYLAYVENQHITIYPNEGGGTWGWDAPELPTQDGWYTINLNQKGQYATAVNLTPARIQRSSLELPTADGKNYVYNEFGKFLVSSKCQVGFDIIGSMEYYYSRKNVSFLYDTKGNVIGVIDGQALSGVGAHEHDYQCIKVYVYDDADARTEEASPDVHEKWCTICGAWSEEAHTLAYQAATATEDGSLTCADCGYRAIIGKHTHTSESDTWQYDQNVHFHPCQYPLCREHVDEQEHSFEDGVCSVCGYKEGTSEEFLKMLAMLMSSIGDDERVRFTDVAEDSWYAEAVSDVVRIGLMQGVSSERFAPEASCTRAMIWTILARMDGEKITGADWVERAAAWAVSTGISDGTNPQAAVTREQLITMLWRAAGEPQMSHSLDRYQDGAAVSAYARPAVAWALEKGVLNSNTNVLRPSAGATRAEVAAILVRYCLQY